ncbi:hypothetical protein DAEQUDRAFT_726583 [Daedalea quercina L-15889]|uniref:F-box domain-containing protein n=1 Tax=Daedalea quercina L-15889 TaxID=1314783 RepID=A0A165QKS3_9APHY|nr:hypothetical protein DAEQUDRAFT_726583 [Daedalea quercina L-15889]
MPVTTRRAKLRVPQIQQYSPIGDDGYLSSELSDADDNTSDWEDNRRKGSNGPQNRQKKRPRVMKSTWPSRTKHRGANGQLCVFPTLPLDIIYEILALLTPVDLANLAQANGAFRATLMSPQAHKLWKAARKYAGNVPDCPPNVREVSWARFIYGRPRCQECGVVNIHYVDFALMRRVCKKCKQKKLVYSKHFAKRYPDFDPAMLELIPHTSIGCSSVRYSNPNSKFYWEDDIYAMAKIYGEYQLAIYQRRPGAKEALEKYRHERVEYVAAVSEHVNTCQRQSADLIKYRASLVRERIDKQYDAIVDRFRELGYEDQDIEAIQYACAANKDRVFTERVWTRVRPCLQRIIDAARCRRLERDERAIIDARKLLVRNAYDDYKQTLRPIEWIHLPPLQFIYVVPEFHSLIYTNLDVPLEQASCNEAATRLPEHISAFNETLKKYLLQGLIDHTAPRRKGKKVPEDYDRLALATSVFANNTGLVACSLDDVAAYLAWHETKGIHDTSSYIPMLEAQYWPIWGLTFQDRYWNQTGSTAMKSLLAAASLDPTTARPGDLDEMDRRFVCEHCFGAKLAHSWRGYITHHLTSHKWQKPLVRVLSEEDSATMREAEGDDRAGDQKMWSCNHCAVHFNNLQTRPVVEKHVQETHAINEPAETVDLFHAFPTARWRPDPQPCWIYY